MPTFFVEGWTPRVLLVRHACHEVNIGRDTIKQKIIVTRPGPTASAVATTSILRFRPPGMRGKSLVGTHLNLDIWKMQGNTAPNVVV